MSDYSLLGVSLESFAFSMMVSAPVLGSTGCLLSSTIAFGGFLSIIPLSVKFEVFIALLPLSSLFASSVAYLALSPFSAFAVGGGLATTRCVRSTVDRYRIWNDVFVDLQRVFLKANDANWCI